MSSIRVYPLQLPVALIEGHSFVPERNARERPRDQGEMRMRPRFRSVPEMCSVCWFYERQEQFDAFDAWYEDALIAGTQDFDVRVQDRGTEVGLRWYTAQFVGDYSCEVLDALMYRVSATLRLVENLGTLRIPPGIEATIGVRYGLMAQMAGPRLAATIRVRYGLSAEMVIPLLAAKIGVSFGMAWVLPSGPPSGAMRETEAGIARETDSGIAREPDDEMTMETVPPTLPAYGPAHIDSVVLLLQGNDAVASTSFADASPIGRVQSGTGSVAASDGPPLFGNARSIAFAGGRVVLDPTAPTPGWHDYALTAWDFTLDAWVYITAGSTGGAIWSNHDFSVGTGIEIQINGLSGSHSLRLKLDGTLLPAGGTIEPIPTSQWAHIEVGRLGVTYRLFVNGVLSGLPITKGFNHPATADVRLGDTATTGSFPLDGVRLKHLRLTKGICRHTSSFAPPTAQPDGTRPGDPHLASVKLLLEGAGANGSTTIVDSSPAARALTAVGSLAISTARARFGESSIRTKLDFGDPHGYIQVAAGSVPADFDFSSGVFTIEAWVWLLSDGLHTLYSARNDGTNTQGLKIEINPSRQITAWCNGAQLTAVGYSLAGGAWEHVMVTGDGASVYILKNGVLAASAARTITTPSGVGVRIGIDNAGFGPMHGYVQHMRITKGVCRATGTLIAGAAYCPPVTPYPKT